MRQRETSPREEPRARRLCCWPEQAATWLGAWLLRGVLPALPDAAPAARQDRPDACYAASRSVALLLTVLIALFVRSRMGIAMTLVQAFDGVIGEAWGHFSQVAIAQDFETKTVHRTVFVSIALSH